MSLNYVIVLLFSLTAFSAWYKPKFFYLSLWEMGSLAIIALALWSKIILPIGLLWIGVAYLSLRLTPLVKNTKIKVFGGSLLFVYLLAMGMNALPGFESFTLVPSQTLGRSTLPFALEYTLAKPFAGLFVFAFIAQRTESVAEFSRVLFSAKGLAYWGLPSMVLIAIALVAGLQWDVKWLPWFALFMLTNLTMTVIQEEAFFKCFLQQPLQAWQGNKLWILVVVALPFALLHTPKPGVNPLAFYGILLLAGAAYAWPYFKTKKLESAIATHWVVNCFHLVFLTYPLQI